MDGKNELFHRPVIILKKLSHDLCLVAPITSKLKNGTWYIQVVYRDVTKTICLHQITIIDTKRLGKYVVRLPTHSFDSIVKGFDNLYSLKNKI